MAEWFFLDNQTEFGKTFGAPPTLVPSKPTETKNVSAVLMLHKLSEKRKLHMFMHLCMLDLVGHEKVDPSLSVVEVCCQISGVKQVMITEEKLQTFYRGWAI